MSWRAAELIPSWSATLATGSRTRPPAQAGKNGLPPFGCNGFHGIELIIRSSTTPHQESQLRGLDNDPDTGVAAVTDPAADSVGRKANIHSA